PFKVVPLEGTGSEQSVYEGRPRICDLGYLRVPAKTDDDKIVFRCASEPIADFVKKGGDEEATTGRKCLCNALMANVGQAQLQKTGFTETPLLTSGDDVIMVTRFLKGGATSYTAKQVIDFLRSPPSEDDTPVSGAIAAEAVAEADKNGSGENGSGGNGESHETVNVEAGKHA
ncbi:MAG: hypothetical protein HOH74_11945, partial [Gemmatimonadetes bacterium]|nr:hypothetical protein [Gemmatimonadota bacterium]